MLGRSVVILVVASDGDDDRGGENCDVLGRSVVMLVVASDGDNDRGGENCNVLGRSVVVVVLVSNGDVKSTVLVVLGSGGIPGLQHTPPQSTSVI